jgi:hypothetical protein
MAWVWWKKIKILYMYSHKIAHIYVIVHTLLYQYLHQFTYYLHFISSNSCLSICQIKAVIYFISGVLKIVWIYRNFTTWLVSPSDCNKYTHEVTRQTQNVTHTQQEQLKQIIWSCGCLFFIDFYRVITLNPSNNAPGHRTLRWSDKLDRLKHL